MKTQERTFNGSGVESENAQQTLLQLIENRPESQLIVTKEKEIKISNEQKAISKILEIKPELTDEIKEIIESVDKENEDNENNQEQEDCETLDFLEMKRLPFNKSTIKVKSLFNQHFIDVAKSLVCVHPFILFLLEYFMPYCGIWAGFVFQESQKT